MPPSYGVPGGPGNEPLRFVRLSLTGSAWIFERVSALMSASSLAILLALWPAMMKVEVQVGGLYRVVKSVLGRLKN